ncbi:unnamed protein product [Spirodela intermedia]|uniref:Uncharacterized protein n=1 Tax=Spirodela intermedia TaxID=51605 RepID=A0A7I8J236_SPIIN|nr:unnamed protein product [Spirodela intermedia]CAA6664129.1 unnamed protein product [Spirodela intermedia]
MTSWMEVGHVSRSFILRSAQQEEALHRICSTHVPPSVHSRSNPYSHLCPDYTSNPLAGPAGWRMKTS